VLAGAGFVFAAWPLAIAAPEVRAATARAFRLRLWGTLIKDPSLEWTVARF
jgi:hypothetical protein